MHIPYISLHILYMTPARDPKQQHFETIWEAPWGGIWGQGGIWRLNDVLEQNCAKTNVFYRRKCRDLLFRLSFGGVTLTVYRAGAQKLASDQGEGARATLMDILS